MDSSRDNKGQKKKSKNDKQPEEGQKRSGNPQKAGQRSDSKDDDTKQPPEPQRKGTSSSVESEPASTKLSRIASGFGRLSKTSTGLSSKSTESSDNLTPEEAKEKVGEKIFKKMRDDQGKFSASKVLSTILKNMTVTPAMRSGARFKPAPPTGKGKEAESSCSDSEEEGDHDVEIVIWDEDEAKRFEAPFWINFHVPFDRKYKRPVTNWKDSEHYKLHEFDQQGPRNEREKYLTKVLNDVSKPVSKENPKKTLAVYLWFHEAIEKYDDQAAEDVKTVLDTLVRMTKFAKLRIVCRFVAQEDPRLAEHKYEAQAMNMTAVIIRMLADEIAVAGEDWGTVRATPPIKQGEDPFTLTQDFMDGSKLVKGRPLQESMYKNTDAEQFLAFHERARREPQARHIYTGTEADDEIRPDPLPKYYFRDS